MEFRDVAVCYRPKLGSCPGGHDLGCGTHQPLAYCYGISADICRKFARVRSILKKHEEHAWRAAKFATGDG